MQRLKSSLVWQTSTARGSCAAPGGVQPVLKDIVSVGALVPAWTLIVLHTVAGSLRPVGVGSVQGRACRSGTLTGTEQAVGCHKAQSQAALGWQEAEVARAEHRACWTVDWTECVAGLEQSRLVWVHAFFMFGQATPV